MSSNSFRTSYRVTWADTDAAQVVHYSNYFRLFERAEEEFYRQLGFSFTDVSIKGFWFPRVEAFCQYKRPARFNDVLEIELTVEDLKEKSVKYGFKIFNKETAVLLAVGYVVVVVADRKTETAVRIPKEIADKLKQFCR
jgi:acyl-CoA thioester hydrolase